MPNKTTLAQRNLLISQLERINRLADIQDEHDDIMDEYWQML